MRLAITILGCSTLLFGCGPVVVLDAGSFGDPDTGVNAPPDDAGVMEDVFLPPGDAVTPDAAPSTKFFLMVTQTPAGDAPMNTWGGVARYDIADEFATAKQATGNGMDIPASAVKDPCGLAFRTRSAELFVGNREGNAGPGSVARFRYDHTTTKFTANGTITGNGLSRVHQVTFSPTEDELFAANRDGGISRFTFDKNGNPVPNGVLTANGWIRGVAVAPDGKRLYATTASYIIRQFDLTNNGAELATVQVPDTNANLHFMLVYKGELYAPAATNGLFYRYKIDANDNLVFVKSTMADTPISIAMSPMGSELFAAGHVTSDVIDRFKLTSNDWIQQKQLQITTGWSLGTVLVFPEDAEPAKLPW
jgi:hypothetical protein